jgi:hypothetical protein
MGNFRKRPNGDYSQKADGNELYALAQHWKSELLFYKDELRFFRRLVDNYVGWMVLRENLDTVRELELDLSETDSKCKDQLRKTNKHLQRLAQMAEDPKRADTRIFRLEHEHLEDEIVGFENTFRTLRKDVSAITEHVMESELIIPTMGQKTIPISA